MTELADVRSFKHLSVDPVLQNPPRQNPDDPAVHIAEASDVAVDFSDLLARRERFVEEIRRLLLGRRGAKRKGSALLAKFDLPCWLFAEVDDDPLATPGATADLSEEEDGGEYENDDKKVLPSCPGEKCDPEYVEELGQKNFDTIMSLIKITHQEFCGEEDSEEETEDDEEDGEEETEDGDLETKDGMRPYPLLAISHATVLCLRTTKCHHRKYRTEDITETDVSYRELEPENMVQILNLTLPESYPHSVTIYGTFAVRDLIHPGRNYVFKRSRDDPIAVHPGSNLPLCSPSRGTYALNRALLDVDLWMKHEADDATADEKFIVGYFELFVRCDYDTKFRNRLYDGIRTHFLDIDYRYVGRGIAGTVIASADITYPCHLRLTAVAKDLGDEIVMFDDMCCKNIHLRHVVAVKMLGKLELCLKLDGYQCYSHTFRAGVDTKPVALGPVKVLVVWSIMNRHRFWY